jgi:CIC family chloride channel protein
MFQPAIGGVLVGALLIVAPQIMGVGYEYVDQALNGGLVFKTLLVLCLLKLTATIVSYASGNAGGIFAPTLYIGAMAGGALGTIVHRVAPFPTGDPGAYALVGMGTLFAGIIRAPMTSVFMIFEITQDYQILVPLMVANLLSYEISRHYQPAPVYHALLQQDGVHLPAASTRGAPRVWTAGEVMGSGALFIPADSPVEDALQTARAKGKPAYLVGTHDNLLGIVTPERLAEAVGSGRGSEPVLSILDETLIHAHPDHPLEVVLQRLAQSGGLLPIVSRERTRTLEGIVTIDDITSFIRRHGAGGTVQSGEPATPD